MAPKNAMKKKLLQSTPADAMITDLGTQSITEALSTTLPTGGNAEMTENEPTTELTDELSVGGRK